MNRDHGSGFGVGLLVGVAVGAAIGILFAPRSGSETRAVIKEKIVDMKSGGWMKKMKESAAGATGAATECPE